MKAMVSFLASFLLVSPAIANTVTLMVSIDRKGTQPAQIDAAKQALLKMECPAHIQNYIPYDQAPYYGVVLLEVDQACMGALVRKISADRRYTVYSNTPMTPGTGLGAAWSR